MIGGQGPPELRSGTGWSNEIATTKEYGGPALVAGPSLARVTAAGPALSKHVHPLPLRARLSGRFNPRAPSHARISPRTAAVERHVSSECGILAMIDLGEPPNGSG